MPLTHEERIRRAIELKEVDRLPFATWMHCHNIDRFPRKLAEFTVQFQKDLDTDFIKFNPYGRLSTVDWGADFRQSQSDFEAPQMTHPVLNTLKDWDRIVPRRGDEGEYAVVLEAIRLTLKELPKDVPLVVTVFSPLTIASWMATEPTIIEHLRTNPERVERGLEVIMNTTIEFAEAAVRNGASGVFMSSKMSHVGALSREEHARFVMKYDVEIFNRVKDKAWLNIEHIHGAKTWREDIVKNYPVPIFNWHDRDDGPSMAEARKITPDKCFWGGISHLKTLNQEGSEDELRAQVKDTWAHNGGRGVILGPGCVMNARVPRDRLKFIAKCVRETARN